MRNVAARALCLSSVMMMAQVARGQSADVPAFDRAAQEFSLRPGDIIRVRIWREPDMSGEFRVDETGSVVLPRLGPESVLNETPSALRRRLSTEYQQYLKNPSIEIDVLRRVRVLGAVRLPSLYPVDATMTVSDVVAAAGGPTPLGYPDRAELIRNGRVIETALAGRTNLADIAIEPGDEIFVPERSWMARNASVVAAAITGSVSLFIALYTRR